MEEKKIYTMLCKPVTEGLGLCNQLCLVANAIENAFQVFSLGKGTIYVPDVEKFVYGGKEYSSTSIEGFHRVGLSLWGEDPLPWVTKNLIVHWKQRTRLPTSCYTDFDGLNWIQTIPDEIHIILCDFVLNINDPDTLPLNCVLDLDAINSVFAPFRIKLVPYSNQNAYYSLFEFYNMNTPRYSSLFHFIVNSLRFQPHYHEYIDNYSLNLKKEKISVVHLRTEWDVSHLATYEMQINRDYFYNQLHQKFIDNIKKHIDPEISDVIVLTYEPENNKVLEWMTENNYTYHLIEKPENVKHQREVSGIYDLIASGLCNDVFIGAFDIHSFEGTSTFSYFIYCMLKNKDVTTVGINIKKIA